MSLSLNELGSLHVLGGQARIQWPRDVPRRVTLVARRLLDVRAALQKDQVVVEHFMRVCTLVVQGYEGDVCPVASDGSSGDGLCGNWE